MFPEGISALHAGGGGVTDEQLRLLADANIIGVVVAGTDGIVEANDAFLATIGYSRSDFFAPLDWRSLTAPEYALRDQLALEELRMRGACTPFEKEYWRKDGSRVPVQVGAALLTREPMRWIAFVQDVTAQKLIERELRQAAVASEVTNRAKDDFVNTLVHELRQPLATITMAALLIRTALQHDPLAERLRRPLEVLDNQVAGLTRLTDELLLASKIVRGAMPMRRAAVDLASLVQDVVADERLRAESAGLAMILDLPDSPVTLTGDAIRLRHVVTNVVGNAIKYTPPGGCIRVVLVQREKVCELRVKDTGVGIDASEIAHVFEPFRRASHEGSGFGIGLAVVRSAVQQHDGSVEIFSEGANRGTEIVVRLPVSPTRDP